LTQLLYEAHAHRSYTCTYAHVHTNTKTTIGSMVRVNNGARLVRVEAQRQTVADNRTHHLLSISLANKKKRVQWYLD